MKKDGWRFKDNLLGNYKDWKYLEWKYFSFISPNTKGFFCYSVGNPRNIFGLRKHIMSYAIYHHGITEVGAFETSKRNTDLSQTNKWIFGDCSIEKKDGGWIIKGDSGRVKWDLVYDCRSQGKGFEIFGDKKEGNWMDWEIFCNHADVEGTIGISNKDIEFSGIGYHDSNLGHWRPSKHPWFWFTFSKRSHGKFITFTLFKLRDRKEGYLLLSVDEDVYILDDFQINADIEEKVPRKYRIRARSKGIEIDLIVKVVSTELLQIKVFDLISLLDLNLLRCRFKLQIDLFGQKHTLEAEGIGEYH